MSYVKINITNKHIEEFVEMIIARMEDWEKEQYTAEDTEKLRENLKTQIGYTLKETKPENLRIFLMDSIMQNLVQHEKNLAEMETEDEHVN